MLIRADPRDEDDLAALVPARPRRADLLRSRTGRHVVTTDRINSAYSRCGAEGDAADGQAPHRPADQLPDHRQLPRLQGGRRQARRRLDGRRPPLLQQEHRLVPRQLREHQPAAGLPAADRPAGARLRPLPPHRLRPVPARAPAGVRARVQRAGRAELLVREAAEPRQHDHAATSRSARAGTRSAATR